MFSTKLFALFVLSAATGSMAGLVAKDNCNDHLGRCDQNGCAGVFNPPDSIRGVCTAGTFSGCPCNRCGDTNGACSDNGCFGQGGRCTAGAFQGCPCN